MSVWRNLKHALAAFRTSSRTFHAAWDRAVKREGIAGRWEGEWRSEANGHHGSLRCVLEPAADNHFQVVFHAKYAGILRICYSARLSAEKVANIHRLKGQADLGLLAGGIYEYEGEVSDDRFLCNYKCQYDHGIFDLRPV